MCVVGIDPAAERKEALGNDGILGQATNYDSNTRSPPG